MTSGQGGNALCMLGGFEGSLLSSPGVLQVWEAAERRNSLNCFLRGYVLCSLTLPRRACQVRCSPFTGKEGLLRKVRGLAPDQGGQALRLRSILQNSVHTETILFLECLFRQVRWTSRQKNLLACLLVLWSLLACLVCMWVCA